MDPLTALGLAANAIACVRSVSDIIQDATGIASSADGYSATTSKLESACTDLKGLCTSVQSYLEQESIVGGDDEVNRIAVIIKDLSKGCKKDCDELVQGLSTLKSTDGGKEKWRDLEVSLMSPRWSDESIREIENRISSSRSTLTLAVSKLLYLSWVAHSKRLENFRYQSDQLQSNQAQALESIKDELDYVQSRFHDQKGEYILTAKDGDDLQELRKRLEALPLREEVVEQDQSVLQSLTFDGRSFRHTQVKAAHAETFKWALLREPDHAGGDSIGKWLATGKGIFWISGKPGCGKSTLMKFIADSAITQQLIQDWAQTREVFIASHYFWIVGTPMQKSLQGLLQTLLFDVFRQCPTLIREICSDRWEQALAKKPWSLTELRNALNKISSREFVRQKFCFFVDGLDEFDGDDGAQADLCQTFQELATPGNIKFVISSRPWNVFEDQFGSSCPKIYMQDRTRNDIRVYVQSSLKEHPRWVAVTANDSQGDSIIREVSERSEGVFLWVYLVTKLLKRGLTNRDSSYEMHRRLQSFPTNLESFFKAIVESVDPFYHSQMATTLQFAIRSGDQPLSFLAYHFQNQEHNDADYANHLPVKLIDKRNLEEIKNDTTRHLHSMTCGLLEINSQSGIVDFLHRTARDFLKTHEMHDSLATKVDGRLNFNPDLSLLRVFVALIKVSAPVISLRRLGPGKYYTSDSDDGNSRSIVQGLVWKALTCASRLEFDSSQDYRYHSLLDELDRSLPSLFPEEESSFFPNYLSSMRQAFFREQLLHFRLFNYLYKKLDSEPTYLVDIGSLLQSPISTLGPDQTLQLRAGGGIEFLLYLLQHQIVDVNAKDRHSGLSHWQELFSYAGRSSNDWNLALDIFAFLLDHGILMVLLQTGADPNVDICGPYSMLQRQKWRYVAAMYVELCSQYLGRLQSDQDLYLGVLEEVLRGCSHDTVQIAYGDFTTLIATKTLEGFPHLDIPFLSKVYDLLRLAANLEGVSTLKDPIAILLHPDQAMIRNADPRAGEVHELEDELKADNSNDSGAVFMNDELMFRDSSVPKTKFDQKGKDIEKDLALLSSKIQDIQINVEDPSIVFQYPKEHTESAATTSNISSNRTTTCISQPVETSITESTSIERSSVAPDIPDIPGKANSIVGSGFESLVSDAEDIGSQSSTKTTGKEMTGKMLMGAFLVEESQFRTLCEEAVTKMDQNRFIRNLRRLLKGFHKDLLKEAQNEAQLATAQLLCSHHGRSRIGQQIYMQLAHDSGGDSSNREHLFSEVSQDTHKVERWLAKIQSVASRRYDQAGVEESHIEPSPFHVETEHEESETVSESGSDDDPIFNTSFPQISDMKAYLQRTKAFKTLLKDFMTLFIPAELRLIVEVIPVDRIWFSSEQDTSVINLAKAWVEDQTRLRWNWWPMQRRKRMLSDGEVRMFWQSNTDRLCWNEITCEQFRWLERIKALSKDVGNNGQLCSVQSKPLKLFWSKPESSRPQEVPPNLSKFTQSAPHQSTPSHTAPSSGNSTGLQEPSGIASEILGIQQPASKDLEMQREFSRIPTQHCHWVLLGVQGSRKVLIPAQIRIENWTTDYHFFKELRDTYKSHRGRLRIWFSIWQLDHCEIVKFTRLASDRMVRAYRDLPTHQDYVYNPKGTSAKNPPMSSDMFDVLINSCDQKCSRLLPHDCFQLKSASHFNCFPRRKLCFDKDEENADIWGLSTVYAVSFAHALIYHLVMMVAPLVFFTWWITAFPQDLQNASVPLTIILALLSLFWSSAGILTSRSGIA